MMKNKPKIFILEDNEERIAYFNDMFPDAELACDAATAIQAMKENVYDVIFLDHDLGGEVFVDSSRDNTGFQVAKVIAETANANADIFVHSLNPAGASNIKGVLPKARVIPFPLLTKVLKKPEQ